MLNSCCGHYSLKTGCIIIGLLLFVIGCLEMIPSDNTRYLGIIELICSVCMLIGIRLVSIFDKRIDKLVSILFCLCYHSCIKSRTETAWIFLFIELNDLILC